MTAILFGSISTLADTSELQREAFNEAFAAHGLDWRWDQEEYRSLLTSNGGAQRIAEYAKQSGEEVDAAAVHRTKSELFREKLAQGVEPRDGVVATIDQARADGLQVGLVTTTTHANVEALLDGLDLAFDVVVDLDVVPESKPDPDAYAYALDQLGESNTTSVAIEDNVGGVQSAAAAGLPVVAFPNANTAAHDFGQASERVETLSLADLTALIGTAR